MLILAIASYQIIAKPTIFCILIVWVSGVFYGISVTVLQGTYTPSLLVRYNVASYLVDRIQGAAN